MQEWTEIRHRVLVERASKRSVCREFGIAHKTLQKILANTEPPDSAPASPPPFGRGCLGSHPDPAFDDQGVGMRGTRVQWHGTLRRSANQSCQLVGTRGSGA